MRFGRWEGCVCRLRQTRGEGGGEQCAPRPNRPAYAASNTDADSNSNADPHADASGSPDRLSNARYRHPAVPHAATVNAP